MLSDPFKRIISTKQAAIEWGMTQDSVKRLARTNQIIARKLEPTDAKSPYMIYKNQQNPKRKK